MRTQVLIVHSDEVRSSCDDILYAAPTPKVTSGLGANAGWDSFPLAPSGIPAKAPPVITKAKVVFKPAPPDLQGTPRPAAPPVPVEASTTVPAAAPAVPAYPAINAPAVDANKELIGKLRAEKEALLGENTRLVARLKEAEDELTEVRNHLRDAQYDLEEACKPCRAPA